MIEQLAINSNTYHGYSLEDAVKGASEAGFSQIEIAAVRDHTAHILPEIHPEQLHQVKQVLQEYKMKCIGISAHSNVMQEEGVANLLKSIDLAVELDCHYIATATGDSHGDTDTIDDHSILAKNLAPVFEKCAILDKTLVLETHGNNFATGKSLQSFITSIQKHQDRVRVNYDTGNVIFYGNTDPYEDLQNTLPYVEFIHLKDKKGENDEWNFPAIGDGNLDYKKIMHILQKGNYQGPISVEIEFTPAGPKNLAEVNHSVKKSYEYLEKLFHTTYK